MKRTLCPSLDAAERCGTFEPVCAGVRIMSRAIVACEHDDGIVIYSEPLQFINQFSYLLIEICDHGRVSCLRITTREISFSVIDRSFSHAIFVCELLHIVIHHFVRCLKGSVRQGGGPHKEELFVTVLVYKTFDLVKHPVGTVVIALESYIACFIEWIILRTECAAEFHERIIQRLSFPVSV